MRKAIIDDGMNPELVLGADFDGYFGIPIIKKPEQLIIQQALHPLVNEIEPSYQPMQLAFMS